MLSLGPVAGAEDVGECHTVSRLNPRGAANKESMCGRVCVRSVVWCVLVSGEWWSEWVYQKLEPGLLVGASMVWLVLGTVCGRPKCPRSIDEGSGWSDLSQEPSPRVGLSAHAAVLALNVRQVRSFHYSQAIDGQMEFKTSCLHRVCGANRLDWIADRVQVRAYLPPYQVVRKKT